MSEPEAPRPEPQTPGGYGSRWWKWLLIYLVIGGGVYALVYFIFFADGYGS
jgi:hypothetical protein